MEIERPEARIFNLVCGVGSLRAYFGYEHGTLYLSVDLKSREDVEVFNLIRAILHGEYDCLGHRESNWDMEGSRSVEVRLSLEETLRRLRSHGVRSVSVPVRSVSAP